MKALIELEGITVEQEKLEWRNRAVSRGRISAASLGNSGPSGHCPSLFFLCFLETRRVISVHTHKHT